MTTTFTNKVYIVTGSASGMGLATATLLLSRGARLGLCDINESALEQCVAALPEEQRQNIISSIVNVVDAAAISSFLGQVKNHFGKLDGIANFAGTGGHRLGSQMIWDTDQDEYDFIMDLNVKALYNILRIALEPGFLNEPGSIVHITSMYAERGFQNGAIFTASKHAANGMVKSAAIEVAKRGIRVNTVMPGVIDTPMTRAGRDLQDVPPPMVPMGRFGLPEEIANMTAFVLSDEASYVTGAHFTVDGGANAAGRHQ